MTQHAPFDAPTDASAPTDALADPAAVRDRPGVETTRSTYEHDAADHCEADLAGKAVVGVTDADGRLLALHNRRIDVTVLPNAGVDPGGDWAAAGREYVEGLAGHPVTLDDVAAVRTVEHVVDGRSRETTTHVVFAASPDGWAPGTTELDGPCGDDWALEWFEAVPAAADGDPRADLERFLG